MLEINKMKIHEIISSIDLIGYSKTNKNRMLKLPKIFKLDYKLGRLLGHLNGNGHISDKSDLINYSNMEKLLVWNFKIYFKDIFGLDLTLCRNKSNLYSCSMRNKNYFWLINELINKINSQRNLPQKFQKGFFSALFDDEASVTVTDKRAHMHFGMINIHIVNNFHTWLQENKIKTSNIYIDTKFRKNKFYYFYVPKTQFKLFDEFIDITSPMKSRKFNNAIEVMV